MPVTSIASFKEAKEKKRERRFKLWKRTEWRYLGGRVHTAYRDYHCDRCIFMINGGEQYRRDVYANYKRIKVERHHRPQCYGPSEDEDRKMRDQIERDREAEREAIRRAA